MAHQKICLFDMDGTLCDYQGALMKELRAISSPGEPPIQLYGDEETPPWLDRRMELIKSQSGFWEDLPVLADGFKILELSVSIGFQPFIATKGPSKAIGAWTEKVRWCRRQIDTLPFMNNRPVGVSVTEDKSLIYGRVLVEDYPPYCEAWLQWRKRGLVVLMDRPYNRSFNHPQVVRFDASEGSYQAVKERLLAAYER